MKKVKFLSLLLVMTLLITCGLAACGDASSASSSAPVSESSAPEVSEAPTAPAENVVAADSTVEGNEGATVAVTVADPFEAMAKEYISYPLEGDNSISIYYYIPGYQDYMDSNYNYNALSAAEEATGVKLEFVEVSDSSINEQFNVMVAGGDYCDLIPAMEYYGSGGTAGLTKAYEDGVIQDIGQYIDENMPNYAAVLETLADATAEGTLIDGKTLAFHQIKDGTYSGNGFVTRGDWIEELGWEWSGDLIPLDEFTDYCREIHDKFQVPNTIYMTDGTVGLEAAFDTAIPALKGDGFMTQITSNIFRYDDEVTSGWITDGYREYLEWVIQMMDEGIIYRDYLSLDTDRMVQNQYQADGTIGIWQSNADKIEEIVDTYGTDNPDLKVQAMPRVTQDPSATYVWNDEVALVATNAGFSMSSTCKQPELVCQWENYFWTLDGYYLGNYGVEGESYHMDGDTPVFDWDQPVTVTGRNAPNAEMAQQLFTMLRFASFYVDNDMLLATFPQTGLDAVKLWTIEDSNSDRRYPSAIVLTAEETDAVSAAESDALTYAPTEAMKFLDGAAELNDANWDTYVQTVLDMGLQTVIDTYQNAYDEFLAGER